MKIVAGIIGRSRYFGFNSPPFPALEFRILSEIEPKIMMEMTRPVSRPRKLRPSAPVFQWYCSVKTRLKVVKRR